MWLGLLREGRPQGKKRVVVAGQFESLIRANIATLSSKTPIFFRFFFQKIDFLEERMVMFTLKGTRIDPATTILFFLHYLRATLSQQSQPPPKGSGQSV